MTYSLPRCARCGKAVMHAYGDVCRECWDEMEYLRAHPTSRWPMTFFVTLAIGYAALLIIEAWGR